MPGGTARARPQPGRPKAIEYRRQRPALDNPHLRMMLDLYHAQIGEGTLIELIRRAGPAGEIQVADVPGREGQDEQPDQQSAWLAPGSHGPAGRHRVSRSPRRACGREAVGDPSILSSRLLGNTSMIGEDRGC